MALQGTLETFSVPEVLRLLSGTRKSGLLALDGDRGGGDVFLTEGRIAAARSDHEPAGRVEAVLFDLLRFTEGSFVFETDAAPPADADAALDVEEALTEAERLLTEWQEIASVVPTLDVGLRLVAAIPGDEVTVTAEQWETLATVGSGTSGTRLGRDLGLGELDASRRIRDVVETGLVELDTIVLDPAPPGAADAVDELDAAPATDDHEERDVAEPAGHDTDLNAGLAGFVAQPDDEGVAGGDSIDEPAGETSEIVEAGETAETGETVEFDEPVAAHADLGESAADLSDDWVDDVSDDAPVAEAVEVNGAAHEGGDEFLSQLANLSPKAAAAIEATASGDDTGGAPRLPDGEADEEINRNLLLKFLSSAKN